MQIWDTAGQERFRTITSAYYRGAQAVMLVYDITSQDTFDHLPSWYDDVQKYTDGETPVVIVGNKIDLSDTCEDWEVNKEIAENFARERDIPLFFCSAKADLHIENPFRKL